MLIKSLTYASVTFIASIFIFIETFASPVVSLVGTTSANATIASFSNFGFVDADTAASLATRDRSLEACVQNIRYLSCFEIDFTGPFPNTRTGRKPILSGSFSSFSPEVVLEVQRDAQLAVIDYIHMRKSLGMGVPVDNTHSFMDRWIQGALAALHLETSEARKAAMLTLGGFLHDVDDYLDDPEHVFSLTYWHDLFKDGLDGKDIVIEIANKLEKDVSGAVSLVRYRNHVYNYAKINPHFDKRIFDFAIQRMIYGAVMFRKFGMSGLLRTQLQNVHKDLILRYIRNEVSSSSPLQAFAEKVPAYYWGLTTKVIAEAVKAHEAPAKENMEISFWIDLLLTPAAYFMNSKEEVKAGEHDPASEKRKLILEYLDLTIAEIQKLPESMRTPIVSFFMGFFDAFAPVMEARKILTPYVRFQMLNEHLIQKIKQAQKADGYFLKSPGF